MELKVKFEECVNQYLKVKYPSGITYKTSDNISLMIFGLIVRPKNGQILKDHNDGVLIRLNDQWVHDGRVYLPEENIRLATKIIINTMYTELFTELDQFSSGIHSLRYRGINDCIRAFIYRYEMNNSIDLDRLKKAYYRYRKNLEKISGNQVSKCPQAIKPQRNYGEYFTRALR